MQSLKVFGGFFVDERLRQFRKTDNPHVFFDFKSEQGEKLLKGIRVLNDLETFTGTECY